MKGSNARATCRENSQTRAIAVLNQLISITFLSVLRRVGKMESRGLISHTKILDIFITSEAQHVHLRSASHARTDRFIDDNAIRERGGDECGTIGELSPCRVVVQSDPGEAVAE